MCVLTIRITGWTTVFGSSRSRVVTEWWREPVRTMAVTQTVTNTVAITVVGTGTSSQPQTVDRHAFLVYTHLRKNIILLNMAMSWWTKAYLSLSALGSVWCQAGINLVDTQINDSSPAWHNSALDVNEALG